MSAALAVMASQVSATSSKRSAQQHLTVVFTPREIEADRSQYLTPHNVDELRKFGRVKYVKDLSARSIAGATRLLLLNGLLAETLTRGDLVATKKTLQSVATGHHFYNVDHIKAECEAAKVTFIDASSGVDRAVAASICSGMHDAASGMMAQRCQLYQGTKDAIQNAWKQGNPHARPLTKCVVGLISLGNVGQQVASILKGFILSGIGPNRVLAWSRRGGLKPERTNELGAYEVAPSLDYLLERSHVVSLHTRLVDGETEKLIGKHQLDVFTRTKSDGSEALALVNFARGGLVDEQALIEVLKHHPHLSAVLDVVANEPLLDSAHPFYQLPNVFLTPHSAVLPAVLAEATLDAIRALHPVAGSHSR